MKAIVLKAQGRDIGQGAELCWDCAGQLHASQSVTASIQ